MSLVAVGPPTEDVVLWADVQDADLYRYVVEERRPLILVGRSATSCMGAARDAHAAAASLATLTGMDVGQVLPCPEDLADKLREQSPPGEHEAETPRGRFLYCQAASNVIVCLSTGETLGPDPLHLRLLFESLEYSDARPAGIYASRLDRYARSHTALMRFYDAVAHTPNPDNLWIGDGSSGRWALDQPHTPALLAMLAAARENELHAKKAGARRRRSAR